MKIIIGKNKSQKPSRVGLSAGKIPPEFGVRNWNGWCGQKLERMVWSKIGTDGVVKNWNDSWGITKCGLGHVEGLIKDMHDRS